MTQDQSRTTPADTAQCSAGHPNRPEYRFCIYCGQPVIMTPVLEAESVSTLEPGGMPASVAARGRGSRRRPGVPLKRLVASIVIVVLAAGAILAGISLTHRATSQASVSRHVNSSVRTSHHTKTTPSPTAAGPVLTWAGYDGVHLRDALGDAATTLNGNLAWGCPSNPGTYMVVTGIPKDILITDEAGTALQVNVIQLTGPTASGPDGIRAGMTIAQARAASGQPLAASISPTTGEHYYTITKNNEVFGFVANPRVADITLATPAEIQGGILGGGFGGC